MSERLDTEGWSRAEALFHDALKQPPAEREAWVLARTEDDPTIRRVTLAMVREDQRGDSVLDQEIDRIAGAVLDGSVPHLDQVGPYRILGVLGQGGMGVVYLGQREDLGTRVAIKVLRDASLSQDRRDRFLTEQRTLAQLRHPRIASLHDADALPDGTPYFVMEYVEGRDLSQFLAEETPTPAERIDLFRAICETVRFAHARAVIHRDLKPSNIRVTPDGEPVLLDFGIAKHLDAVGGRTPVTRPGLLPLTPAYASPAQLRGEPVGVDTDVYALGVMLYEMMGGVSPFPLEGLPPAKVVETLLAAPVRPPSERTDPGRKRGMGEGRWRDLDVICATAMHRDTERRYPSVEALIRDLDHLRSDEPLEARPDSLRYRMAKFVQRNRPVVLLGAAAAAVLAGVTVLSTARIAQARDRAVAEADRARRIQEFTEGLFEGGDPVAGPADTLRVLTLVDRGVQEARFLGDDPAQQADVYLTLGRIALQLGRYEQSDSLFAEAAAAHGRVSTPTPGFPIDLATLQAEVDVLQGRYPEAQATASDALSLAQAQRDSLRAAEASLVLGRALEGAGEYPDAIRALESAVQTIEAQAADPSRLADALGHLANAWFYSGNLDSADVLNRRAMEVERGLHGDRHPNIADALINLAVTEFQRGRYAEGEPMLREALSIFEGHYGGEHPQTASALRMLGQNLIYQGRLDEAEPHVRRSLEISRRTLEPLHPRMANVLGDLAYIELQAGEHARAVDRYREIVDIYRASNGERHYFVAIGMSNLANALMEAGRLPEAEAMFEEVVDRFRESRGAEHLDTGIALIKLGHARVLQARAVDALAPLEQGFEIVAAESEPTVSWLTTARRDLLRVYEALGQDQNAERVRAEQLRVEAARGS